MWRGGREAAVLGLLAASSLVCDSVTVLFSGATSGDGAGATGAGAGASGAAAAGGSSGLGGAGAQGGTASGAAGGNPDGHAGTSGNGGAGGMIVDPCATECGAEELCDGIHAGLDDDCDGTVDEACPCTPGTVESCFKGEPAYHDKPGCFPGSQHCTAFGFWSGCLGGVHATDHCYDPHAGCHPITDYPFVPVHLKDGTGDFSADATSEAWTVGCPPGVDPCPAVTGSTPQDEFQPVQSGEYAVHYFKQGPNGLATCDYPLFVGAPGLRVELEWEHGVAGPQDTGVDLDLHVHKPQDVMPWGGSNGMLVECAYYNCQFGNFVPPGANAPNWFDGVAPPDPVNWYLDPVLEKNTCYFAPRGKGQLWQDNAMGCHNPRLDLDNITCDSTILHPTEPTFCAPENINIDYPPTSQWIRIGVHYYSSHGVTYDVHPRVRIFCNAVLAAELGPEGYAAPVTFTPADGGDRFWLVADVGFFDDPCIYQKCKVEPLYYDPALHSALLTTVAMVHQSYGPPYPP